MTRKHPTFREPLGLEVVERMPAELYHSLPAVSSHGLIRVTKSPAHYLDERETPSEPTPALIFGTLIHAALLEPARFRERMVIQPKFDRRTKIGKQDYEEFQAGLSEDSIVVTEEQCDRIERMLLKLLAHPKASKLLAEGRSEISYFWNDPVTGLECKARADYLRDGVIIDVKSVRDASYEAFQRAVLQNGWHIQGAHYHEGYRRVFKKDAAFLWLAIENEAPHEIALYAANEATMDKGQQVRLKAIKRLSECIERDEFPGYDPNIQNLALPHYAFFDEETA